MEKVMSMNKLKLALIGTTFVAGMALNANAMAFANMNFSDTHFLIGGQLGLSRADYGSTLKDIVSVFPSYSYKRGGVGGRVFLGAEFTRIIGLELGYNFIPTNRYDISSPVGNADFKERTRALDLMARFQLPLHAFDLYAKVGGAYVWSKLSATTNGLANVSSSIKRSALRPAYGLGLNYNINDRWAIDASWEQIYGRKSSPQDLATGHLKTPLINFIGVGVTAKIG